MTTLVLRLLFITSVFLFALPANAGTLYEADTVKAVRAGSAELFSLPELGALVAAQGNVLTVRFVSPPSNRKPPYKEVDLREGDALLMVNSRRIRTISELTSAYEAIAVGSEVKLGLERGKEMMIAAFLKGDPKDFPRMQFRMQRGPADGTEIFPAVGVALAEKGKQVVVKEILPIETGAVRKLDVRQGDVIVSLNGWVVTSLKAYVEKFETIPVGETMEWKLKRGGRTVIVSFPRPKPAGPMIIRRESR